MKKNKLKTHKGLKKRFKITATGKVTRNSKKNRKYSYAYSKKRKNTDKKTKELNKSQSKKVKRLLIKS